MPFTPENNRKGGERNQFEQPPTQSDAASREAAAKKLGNMATKNSVNNKPKK